MIELLEKRPEAICAIQVPRVAVVGKTLQESWDLSLELDQEGYSSALTQLRKIGTVEGLIPAPAAVVLTSELEPEDMVSVHACLQQSPKLSKLPVVALSQYSERKIGFALAGKLKASATAHDLAGQLNAILGQKAGQLATVAA